MSIKVSPLSRAVLGGDAAAFEDITAARRARRWVVHDGLPKVVARVLPAGTPQMVMKINLPPAPAGDAPDRRFVRLYAKFGDTELTVRAEVFVGGVVQPAYSRAIPITYPV